MATISTSRIAAAQVSRFQESVTLPDGSVVMGVFDLRLPVADGLDGVYVGRAMRVDHQANPAVRMTDSDAALVSKNDRLTIRGVEYLAVDDPVYDGSGMALITLMPAPADDDRAPLPMRQWR